MAACAGVGLQYKHEMSYCHTYGIVVHLKFDFDVLFSDILVHLQNPNPD